MVAAEAATKLVVNPLTVRLSSWLMWRKIEGRPDADQVSHKIIANLTTRSVGTSGRLES